MISAIVLREYWNLRPDDGLVGTRDVGTGSRDIPTKSGRVAALRALTICFRFQTRLLPRHVDVTNYCDMFLLSWFVNNLTVTELHSLIQYFTYINQ